MGGERSAQSSVISVRAQPRWTHLPESFMYRSGFALSPLWRKSTKKFVRRGVLSCVLYGMLYVRQAQVNILVWAGSGSYNYVRKDQVIIIVRQTGVLIII